MPARDVLSHHAVKDPRTGRIAAARPRRDKTGRIEARRENPAVGIRLLRPPETQNHRAPLQGRRPEARHHLQRQEGAREKIILILNNQKQTKEIKLDFYKEQNNNSGIECKYTIFSKNVGKKLTYRDENITQKKKNDYKEGLLYLLNEIINEKNDDELEIIEPKNTLISKENISSDNILNLSTFSYNREQKHPSSDYDSILSDKTIKKIKQLTNGNFIVICENKLLLLDFFYNYKDIIEYKENIVNAWENIINKTELLIKFENRIHLIEIKKKQIFT